MKSMDSAHKVIITTYEEFAANKKKDNYHGVILVTMEYDMTDEQLEKQQDQFEYYSTAPICHWALTEPLKNDPKSEEGINFFKELFKDKLVNDGEPIILTHKLERDAASFIEGLD